MVHLFQVASSISNQQSGEELLEMGNHYRIKKIFQLKNLFN